MHIAQQGGRIIETARWQIDFWLPAGRALRDALIHQPLDSVQLHRSDDGSDVDGFVQGGASAQRAHTLAYSCGQRFCDAFLHQQARSRATYLPLVEPDSIHQPLYCAVQVGVFEDHERRLAAELER